MNRYLLLCAASALGAMSARPAVASTTVHLGSNCDYFVMYHSGGNYWAAVHHGGVSCASTSLQNDPGVYGKGGKTPKKVKGTVQFADSLLANKGYSGGLDYEFSYPFGAGGSWAIIATTNGTTAFILNSGKQTAKAYPGARKSSLSDAIALLKPWKN